MAFNRTLHKFNKCTVILAASQMLLVGMIYRNKNSFWASPNLFGSHIIDLALPQSNETRLLPESSPADTGSEHKTKTGSSFLHSSGKLIEGWNKTAMNRIRITIGLGITTRHLANLTAETLGTCLVFYRSMMTSFCLTCSQGYDYHFFLAYDYNDPHMSQQTFRGKFEMEFDRFTSQECNVKSRYFVHFVECNHTGKPAWAQNDAMVEAYLAGMDYFYRVNDDTVMNTGNWTKIFIRKLNKMRPPNVGVVGPNHSGGNLMTMTYDFVHKTHIEIHGCYYPRYFRDWDADTWITNVYKPNNSLKVRRVRLVHTMEKGTRYEGTLLPRKDVNEQTRKDVAVLKRYVDRKMEGFITRDPRTVIAMSLYRCDISHIWGAIRNAQLAPVVFPGWSIKFYIRHTLVTECMKTEVLKCLVDLGAEIEVVSNNKAVPSVASNYLVTIDPSVDVFLLRNPHERLSERDFAAVSDWLSRENESEAVHCLKDHPKFLDANMVNGQWGAKSRELRNKLKGISIVRLLSHYIPKQTNISFGQENALLDAFLNTTLWVLVKNHVLTHDSVSCSRRNEHNVLAFPVERHDEQFIGQIFDWHEWMDTTYEVQPYQLDNSTEC